jgi:hypothetical protein
VAPSTAPFTFSFKSFGDNDVTSIEEYFIIDNHAVTFNQDLTENAELVFLNSDSATVNIHLKDGVTVTKHFGFVEGKIIERLN